MSTQSLLLLDELRQRAGLEAEPIVPGDYLGIMFDEVLVSVRIADDDVLHLLSTIKVEPAQAERILPLALAESERLAAAGEQPIGYDDDDDRLVIRRAVRTGGLSFAEFEQRILDLVELCERLGRAEPAASGKGADAPPENAIFA